MPEQKLAIQVAYSLNDEETRKREMRALLKLSKHLEVDKMLIVTKEEEFSIEMEERQIEVVPVWETVVVKQLQILFG